MTHCSLSVKGNLMFLTDQMLFNTNQNMKIGFHCIWEIQPQTQNGPNDEGDLCF